MRIQMRECRVIEIVTPKKVLLNGLWFGPYFAPADAKAMAGKKASKGKSKKPKRAIIWVHGLGSSLFSKLSVVEKLVDKNTAVITFNNRGHDIVSAIRRAGRLRPKGLRRTEGGSAHEVFADCVDDIQGAINFAHRAGINNIYLAGHSTGCQKSIYWAYRKKSRGVRGIILLAPISDYSAALHLERRTKVTRAAKAARALVARKKPHALLAEAMWPEHIDAQRFLSLYTPDSVEEIFAYAQPNKIPRLLKAVRLPSLAILAGADEFADRPAKKIAEWFERNTGANLETLIIPRATHSFRGKEKEVSSAMRNWMKNL